MLISLLLLAVAASGGLALTYLIVDDEPLMWRLAAGTVLGSAVFGTLVFVTASFVGLNYGSAAVCLLLTASPAFLFLRPGIGAKFRQDRQKAGGKMHGANARKMLRFVYYAFFLLIFWLFFDRTLYELADGIYTGGSQNLGDLPFHLGAIYSFTEGGNFPPQNPSWAGAKFAYPFVSDLLTAAFMTLGADLRNAMFVQNVAWAFSLFILIERFAARLTGNKLAGRIAPVLLFLSGGLGFAWFLKDQAESGKAIFDFVWNLSRDYTINDQFRWGNSLVVLFMTQRSLLLGMPITLIVLGYLWRVFSSAEPINTEKWGRVSKFGLPVLIGIFAGTLPLIHLHSLAVLFVVTGVLFVIQPNKWPTWVALGLGVSVIAVPELAWSLTGTASDTTKFIGWHFGWDKREDNVLWFWIKNTGIFIPVLAAGIYLYLRLRKPSSDAAVTDVANREPDRTLLLYFYVPFVLLFLIANVAKLAPWEWDNIKILIYWFIASIPFVALALAWAWENGTKWRVASAFAFAALIMAGSLDVWRTVSGQVSMRVFDAEGISIAQQIKSKTSRDAIILNAPTYNSPVVLSGRQSLMRYSGHLASHGIDYYPRELDVKKIYEGGAVSDMLLQKYDISYVLISPEERNQHKANEDHFKKYPVAAESGQYRLYKVK